MKPSKLVIIPSLKAQRVSENEVVITRKFLDGILEYQKYWPGSIVVWMEPADGPSNNLDNVTICLDEVPFQVEVASFDGFASSQLLDSDAVVLATAGSRQSGFSNVCRRRQIPCIYITETSLKTKIQIAKAAVNNPLRRARRCLRAIFQEKGMRKSIAASDGVQCNGTPVYEAYQGINPNPLLFFDSRVTEDMLISEGALAARLSHCLERKPLRLCFSGRLMKIKGVDHLVPLAEELRRLNVDFKLFICGDGELDESMRQSIEHHGLSDCVEMMGVLDFKDELVPFVKKDVDLFVCCHRQGDPSCTYLETMSCGVPIVGYDNEAFAGVVEHSRAGWLVKMDRVDLLAKMIAGLNQDRGLIKEGSIRSLEFARSRTFEKTFSKRIAHIEEVVSSVAAKREDN